MKYAYKMFDGKIGKFKALEDDYLTRVLEVNGYTIQRSTFAMYKLLLSTGQEDVAIRFNVIPSPENLILDESIFKKLDIRRAMRSLIVTPAVEYVAATETTPEILEVKEVTQEDILNLILASSEKIKNDWNDAPGVIDLNDPLVKQALQSANLDIAEIKLAILKIR